MKRLVLIILCLLLAGCAAPEETVETTLPVETAAQVTEIPTEVTFKKVLPLADTTMDELDFSILAVSLEEGDAYVDDTGKMQMDLKIYSYDKYDLVDISLLAVGDILVTHAGEVEVASLERDASGTVYINGGFLNEGLDLVTDEGGIYYERGFNDHKNWYEVGEATIHVSVDLEFCDNSDPQLDEVIYYPGSFLVGEVTNYDFTPYNTTVRVEDGQIVEMHRRYIP